MAAGRIEAGTLDGLAALCGVEYQPGDSESRAAYMEATYELHSTIANASGNRRLAAAIIQLLDESRRIRHLGLASMDINRELHAQHAALVAAIRDGDGEKAEMICAEHIEASRKMSIDAIINSPEILDQELEQKVK